VGQIPVSLTAGPTSEAAFGPLLGPDDEEQCASSDVETSPARCSPVSKMLLDDSLVTVQLGSIRMLWMLGCYGYHGLAHGALHKAKYLKYRTCLLLRRTGIYWEKAPKQYA